MPGIKIGLNRDDAQLNTKGDKESKKNAKFLRTTIQKITVEANEKVVNLLDVILDLNTGKKISILNQLALRFTFIANRTTHPKSLETYPKQLTGGYPAFHPIKKFLLKQMLCRRVAINLN